MHSDLPAESIAAIATVIAALIAGAFAFVNLTLSKEQKTSEFRQAWIDGLREDLAVFFAGARTFARATQELAASRRRGEATSLLGVAAEKISEIRYQAAETRYRVQLRLNMNEVEHRELLRLMKVAIDEQNKVLAGEGDTEMTLKAIDTAAEFAPQILKLEWERVKSGEVAFRVVRNWVAPLIVVSSLLFIAFVWSGRLSI